MGPEEDRRQTAVHRARRALAVPQHGERHTGSCGSGEAAKRRRRATSWGEPFAHAQHPNDVWSIDLKGWFRTGDGMRIDPLTAQDAMSRYLLVCDGLDRPTGPEVKRSLERAFREYGLPRVVRTDNGPPFASVGLGSLTPLSAWWVKLGIVPERIEPGHPEQNGRLERLHRTLKAETATPPKANRRRQRRALIRFRHSYNVERPHEALGQRPPSLLYIVQVLSCTHQLTTVRSRSHGTQCPQQRRDQVEGRPGIRQCVSQRRARRPRTTGRANLVHTVRPTPHRHTR